MRSAPRVWITRARPAAEATAARLAELGYEPLVDPVLEVRPLAAELDLTGVAALAFTSRNAVEAFAGVRPERTLRVFAVGDATAAAARAAGFTDVTSARGDAEALAAAIARLASDLPGTVLHPSARQPAADLSALLQAHGVPARATPVYETVPRTPAEALARLDDIDVVLVHSPRAARRLAELLRPGAAGPLFACISAAAAAPLREAAHEKVVHAPFPDETGLLKVLPRPDFS